MIHYCIQRPVAVLMSFGALLLFGLAALHVLPVSLLPAIETPQLVVRVRLPNTPATALEQQVTTLLRENLLTVSGLEDIESKTANHTASLSLYFRFGTRMDIAFIEVNEKIDQLSNQLPREMARPQVIRLSTSDIPLMRLQVIPKRREAYDQVSALVQKTIKKRLEQLPGVSLVDLHGIRETGYEIQIKADVLQAVGIRTEVLTTVIQQANRELGSISVRDGQYRYFLRVGTPLQDPQAIGQLPVPLPNGAILPLYKLATVRTITLEPTGYHLFNGKEGMVLTIHKQANAQMDKLAPTIESLVTKLQNEYPDVSLHLTQNQHFLLEASIDNLVQSLIAGGILTIAILFLFLGNFASPALMGVSIPISLVCTFTLFYTLDISLNIISLSGLALGLGILIDNTIVVLDNITRKRRSGMPTAESCSTGTEEVVAPVISQVLTTIAIYLPLILLSGLAGVLITDQAIALTISLLVSLLIACILIPTLYYLVFKKATSEMREDTRFYLWILQGYHTWISWIFRNPYPVLILTALVGIAGIWMVIKLPVTALPDLKKTETQVHIDWNAPIDAAENLRRTKALDQLLQQAGATLRESDAGIPQFLYIQEDYTTTQAQLYYRASSPQEKQRIDSRVRQWLRAEYPQAQCSISDAPNAFTQLFERRVPYFEAQFQPRTGSFTIEHALRLEHILHQIHEIGWVKGEGFSQEPIIELIPDALRMAQYGVSWSELHAHLAFSFGNTSITEIRRFGDTRILRLEQPRDKHTLLNGSIPRAGGGSIPLRAIATYRYTSDYKYITASKTGQYKSVRFDEPAKDYERIQRALRKLASKNDFYITFSGTHLKNQENSRQLRTILIFALALLYLILAIQFEHLLQPLLVMSTLPMGIFGSALFLYLRGASLDMMAAIGFIVVLGIITDDPILKIHTINRLRKVYETQGLPPTYALERAIREAGEVCLKPVLMTSLTTILALIPILFSESIGADLQKTMVLVITGGLSVGTFFALGFIPLAYWLTAKK